MLSRMIFRVLCWSDLLDDIDGGVGFIGVREELKVQCRTCLLYDRSRAPVEQLNRWGLLLRGATRQRWRCTFKSSWHRWGGVKALWMDGIDCLESMVTNAESRAKL